MKAGLSGLFCLSMFRIPLLTIVFISAKIVAQCNYCDQRDLRLKLSNFWKKIHGNHCLKYDIRLYSFPVCDSAGYHLVFEDNFEQEKLDTLVWQIQPWRQGALATDAWMEYNSMDNVLLENGLLKIVARKDTVDAKAVYWETEDEHLEDSRPNFRRYFYTSANLWSRSVFFMGKFEARIKMPASKGLWPAFWLYGGKRWNEIDIFDNYKPGLMVTSSGFDFDGDGKAEGCPKTIEDIDITQWHVYTLIWEFDRIVWQVDGKTVRELPRFTTYGGKPVYCGTKVKKRKYLAAQFFPLEPMHVIFNLSVGSGKGPAGLPDDSTLFPSMMEIDYIKVYQKIDCLK